MQAMLAMQEDRVLIVEDQEPVSKALALLFELHGIQSDVARSPEHALERLRRGGYGVVIQDMNFSPGATSGEEGITLFRRLRDEDPELPILLITAWTSLETAVRLVKEGATDYLAKPWDDGRLLEVVRGLLDVRAQRKELEAPLRSREEIAARHDLRGLVYRSDAMHRAVSLAIRVAPADVPVLITGPSGSGKEKLAEVVQANSKRAGRPFLRVNAGGLPDTLLESELFGAEPGAFTGSRERRPGRFEAADGGTLLLDEIGNLSESGQMKLLRVLQSGEFERLGSNETRRVDVRIVCATNANLHREIERGRFRRDLFFRLNVIELAIPELRSRAEDVLPLAEHFLRAQGSEREAGLFLNEESRARLEKHDWPGNVRELENRIQRATLVASAPEITPADLGLDEAAPASADGDPERREILDALQRAGGVVAKVAAELGISRQALYRRMSRLGIVLERRARAPWQRGGEDEA